MRPVSLVRCEDYDPGRMEQALSDVLAPLGGMSAFVPGGSRVLVKPNLLMKAAPERAVTTHPALVSAVLRAVKACGPSEIVVADSPGGRGTAYTAKAIFETSGLAEVCSREGVELEMLDRSVTRVPSPDGRLYTSFKVGRRVADADVLISLPKLKTHGFMMLTGAVKNMFGCVPGLEKAQFHLKVPDREDFGDMLLDLMLACRPALSIVDAVVGMEGEGPSSGTPRRMGAVLASADAAALDVVAAAMTGFDPLEVYTNLAAHRRGMVPRDADGVEVLGVPWRSIAIEDLAKPAKDVDSRLPVPLRRWLRTRTASRPWLEHPRSCTSCETCMVNCPVEAIAMVDGAPAFDYQRCIGCYCCQELCPVQAIGLKTHGIARLLTARGHRRA